jgi:hypothetical protein
MGVFRNPGRSGGLALLETIIAAVIFAIVAVSLAVLFGSSHHGTLRGLHKIGANSLASDLVEQAIEDARYGVVPANDNGTFQLKTVRRGAESHMDMNYDVAVSVVSVGVYDVMVRVDWTYQDQDFTIEREVLVSPRP